MLNEQWSDFISFIEKTVITKFLIQSIWGVILISFLVLIIALWFFGEQRKVNSTIFLPRLCVCVCVLKRKVLTGMLVWY